MVGGTAPFELPADSPLRLAVDDATESLTGRRPEPIGVPSWTDAHNFVDFGGAQAMVFGPGSIETAHTPAEHIEISQVVSCAKIFMELLSPHSLEKLTAADPRPDQPRYRRAR